jgi:hypothetical protein
MTKINGDKEEIMITGQVQQVKREGDRVALKIGGTWYSAFTNSERMDDVTKDVLSKVAEGHEVQCEIYENKGYKNIGSAIWVTAADAQPGETPKPAPLPEGDKTAGKPAWKPGGGGGGYKAYPPAEVEAAKMASFSSSYAKDVVVALIASGVFKDAGDAGDAVQAIALKIYNTLKGLK